MAAGVILFVTFSRNAKDVPFDARVILSQIDAQHDAVVSSPLINVFQIDLWDVGVI